jgi:ubiquinone/menaquinone biosynthesis C-methylase UbiE
LWEGLLVFRAAGLGTGMRVLDLGLGAGDVAMLAARLVGREGEVVGVERDPEAVASATARVAQAGLSNVRFTQGDAQKLDGVAAGFDAAVGRLVLMYLPNPLLRSGVLAGWCGPVAWFVSMRVTCPTIGLLR